MRISDWNSDVCSSDLGQRLAGAAGRLDADGVEAGGDVEVREFRRLAEEVAVVGGEALRPVEEGVDAGALQDRHPLHHGLQHRGEVVDVLRELVEAEVLRDAVEAPGLGHRLEGAEQDLAGVLLHIRSEEHTSELQSLMRISYAVFCLKKKKTTSQQHQ